MSSVPWSNETERADYFEKLYNEQLAICDRLDAEKQALLFSVQSLSGHLSSARSEAKAEFAEELKYTLIINNEGNCEIFDYDYTLETIDNIAKKG